MGVRINKILGYGLADVESEGYEIADDRFYEYGAAQDAQAREVWTADAFTTYLNNHIEPPILHTRGYDEYWDITDAIVYDGEYGLDNVWMIIPPGQSDWFRRDDIIDYVEEGHLGAESGRVEDRFEILQQGIWPYNGLHQNQYGERLNSTYSCAWWRYCNAVKEGVYAQEDIQDIVIVMDRIAKEMGFKSLHDAKETMVPLIPDIIRAVCEFGNIFTDPATINQLRPMFYVYWS